MRKQRSLFGITPEEELDLQHQGTLRGDQLIGKDGRFVNGGNLASFGQSSSGEFTPDLQSAEGTTVTMSSTQESRKQETAERTPTQGPEQAKSEKKHHYK